MRLIKDLGFKLPKLKNKHKVKMGIYECTICFKHFETNSYNVKYKNQQTCASCRNINQKTIHGMTGTTPYNTWRKMIQRCENIEEQHYDRYGGRGITVCDEWKDFNKYLLWFNETNIPGLTMERMDNDLGYEPSNVEWKSKSHQAQNTCLLRKNNTTGYRGVKTQKRTSKKKGDEVNYIANICVNRKQIHLGIFKEAREAAIARDKYIRENNLNHTQNFKGEEL